MDDKEAKFRASRHHAEIKRKAAKNVVNTVKELVDSKEAKDANDEVTGAFLVNDYIMKQLQNDPKNHIKEHEVTEMIVGKPQGQLINWIAGQASSKITDAIEQSKAHKSSVSSKECETKFQAKSAKK